jgi:hypothetical protein
MCMREKRGKGVDVQQYQYGMVDLGGGFRCVGMVGVVQV